MSKFQIGNQVSFKSKWDGIVNAIITSIDRVEDGIQYYSAKPAPGQKSVTHGWTGISEKKIKLIS